jgi:hypothetical protein
VPSDSDVVVAVDNVALVFVLIFHLLAAAETVGVVPACTKTVTPVLDLLGGGETPL